MTTKAVRTKTEELRDDTIRRLEDKIAAYRGQLGEARKWKLGWDNCKSKLHEGEIKISQLEDHIKSIEKARDTAAKKYAAEKKELNRKINDLQKENDRHQKLWKDARKETGFVKEQCRDDELVYQNRIDSYEKKLKTLNDGLKQKVREKKQLEAQLNETKEELSIARTLLGSVELEHSGCIDQTRQIESLQNQVAGLTEKNKYLRELTEKYKRRWENPT